MPCCGSRRAAARQAPAQRAGSAAPPRQAQARAFTYAGNGRLTVTGPMTGAIYQFTAQGGPVQVHAADVTSLLSVPGLRPVH